MRRNTSVVEFSDCLGMPIASILRSMNSFPMRKHFWLGLILVVVATSTARAHQAAEEMTAAAKKLLSALTPEQRAKAVFEFKSDARLDWHFIPKERKGLTLKEMTEAQRPLAFALLATGLSRQGFTTATNIMSLEPVLAEQEGADRKFPRDPLLYHVFIFGQPDMKGTWGWRLEGHHCSANFTIVNGEFFASTPSFFGSNPAEVRQGPRKGLRVLAGEEDLGRQFVKSLTDDQRKSAVVSSEAPKEIFTEAKRKVQPLENSGIAGAQLNKTQRAALQSLIRHYVERERPDLAETDLMKINKAGVDNIHFVWMGGIEKGEGHYYRVQGPTFLLEYDNTQNNNNHVHAVWRDFNGDFGEDLLKKHYAETPHPN
jgi:hypothetical protein